MDVYIVKIKACTPGKPVALLVSCLCESCSCSWSECAQTQQCLHKSIRLTDLSAPAGTVGGVLTAIIKCLSRFGQDILSHQGTQLYPCTLSLYVFVSLIVCFST